jgi:hypothetical protein
MPKLISIAVESPRHYIALDSEGQVWKGRVATKRGGPSVVTWKLITSEPLDRSSKPAKLWSGPKGDE